MVIYVNIKYNKFGVHIKYLTIYRNNSYIKSVENQSNYKLQVGFLETIR
jgi:hypothetical protein